MSESDTEYVDPEAVAVFQETVWRYYDKYGRHDLPWRAPETTADGRITFDPYKIMVSEIMLQQTQAGRVVPKYLDFLSRFPTLENLAEASLGEVLIAWQGLGYNRRAKFLWQAARKIQATPGSVFPVETTELVALPGIGPNTAGAIRAYAYNQPAVFVETNIRSVFIHHFFGEEDAVPDKAILRLVAGSLPSEDNVKDDNARTIREWYWALMDYGVHLKQTVGNSARRSKTYSRQSPFEGSRRQVRGAVIRTLGAGKADERELSRLISDDRLRPVLDDLVREELIRLDGRTAKYSLI